MARRRPADGDIWFNRDEADRVVEFWESALVHTEGLWAGQPFILRDWQREEMIRPLFGWQRFDGQYDLWVRRYSLLSAWMPRGNGKTPIAAGIIIVGLVADGEMGAQNYGAAEDKDQAGVVFRDVMLMVKHSPVLSPDVDDRLQILESRKRIVDRETDSFYQALPRDELGEGSQGFKPHVWVVDEYHVQKTKSLINALKKGMGKRTQSLGVTISTAGENERTPAGEDYQYATKIRDGEIEDPGTLVYIAEAGVDDDPFDEATWRKANPALGDFLSIQTLRQEAREATEKPSELNDFLRFRLGRWVEYVSGWMPMDAWDASAGLVVEGRLKARRCFGGLVTSSTGPSAVVLLFPGDGFDVLARFFLPDDDLKGRMFRDRVPWDVWARQGFVTLTPGNVIDYKRIRTEIEALASRFELSEVGYQRMAYSQLVQDLEDGELTMVPVGWTFGQISEPTKRVLEHVLGKQLRHSGNPVLRYMAESTVVRSDADGNVKIDTKRSPGYVSGMVALVLAMDRAIRTESFESAYEDHGLEVV